MKVMGFNASPRKGANTFTLVEAVLKGATGKGADTRLVNLHELDMKGCLACEACKEDLGKCVQKDDLSPLLQEMKDCDAIVLGTPIYFLHVNPQLKMLLDRLYCFVGGEIDPETGEVTSYQNVFPEGKKFVIVISRGDDEKTPVFPEKYYTYVNEWLNVVAMSMQASSVEFIHHYHHYGSRIEKDSARNNAELMIEAESVGASLV